MNKYYSIIGGGLTGLTVAKALHNNGIDNFKIFDIKTPEAISKERIKGLHYLHQNPMMMNLPKDVLTNYVKSDSMDLKETKKAYLIKTGLSAWEKESSLDKLQKKVEFYDIRTYKNQLIESFGDRYFQPSTPINFTLLQKIAECSISTFFTISISQIISGDFKSIAIFGKSALPTTRIYSQCRSSDHWVIYNTSKMEQWYRASFIFGNAWLESTDSLFGLYIGQKVITFPNLQSVVKILENDLSNVILIGRYATWNRKILIHDVYNIIDRMVKNGQIR